MPSVRALRVGDVDYVPARWKCDAVLAKRPANRVDLPDGRFLDLSRPENSKDVLEALAAAWERNPLERFAVWNYPQQRRLLAGGRATRLKSFFGGNRAGKTTIGLVDDLIQCVDRTWVPEHLRAFKHWEAPFRCRIVVPDFGQAESVVLDSLRSLVPQAQLLGGGWEKGYQKKLNRLDFANGSFIELKTAVQDVQSHAGTKLDRVHFDEEPFGEKGYQIFNENRMRLTDRKGQLLFTMTPQFGMSWTYDEIYERQDEPWVDVVIAGGLDNPNVDPEELVFQTQNLSVAEREARLFGRFVSFHGAVLANFVEDGPGSHVVDPPTPQHVQSLDVYVGIDPGVAKGGVVWIGFDRDNQALVFDELYPSGLTTPQVAQEIRKRNHAWGIEPEFYVIDPSARNRALTNAQSVEAEYQREGIFPVHGQNDRRAGVLQLRARLDHRALLVNRECSQWLRERRRYLIVEDEETAEGKAKSQSADTFKTTGPDHLMDPTRYVCQERLWFQARPRGASARPYSPDFEPAWNGRPDAGPQDAPPMGVWS